MISKKFVKSSFVYTLAGSLPLISSLVLLPFYTKYLQLTQFGELAIYIAFTLFLQTFINFGLDFSVSILYYDYKEDSNKLKKLIGSSVSLLFITGTGCILLFLLFGEQLFNLIFANKGIDFYPFGMMSVFTAVFNNFFKNYCAIVIHQQRLKRYILINVVNFSLTIIISLIGLHLYPNTLTGPMWGRMLSGLAIFLMAIFFLLTEFGIAFDKSMIKKMLTMAAPMFAYLIMLSTITYIDRYILNYFTNSDEVGIYDLAIKCVILLEFVASGLETTISPIIFSKWSSAGYTENPKEINKYYSGYSATIILLCSFLLVFLPIAVPLFLFKPEYNQALKYIPFLLLSYLFRPWYFYYISPIQFFKKNHILPLVFLLSAITHIILTIFLIKYWGIMGAAFSSITTRPIQLFYLSFWHRKWFKIKSNKIKLFILPIIFCLTVIAIEFLLAEKLPLLSKALESVIGLALIYLIYKNEIKEVFKRFKGRLFPAKS